MIFIILVRVAVYEQVQAAVLRLLRRIPGNDFECGIDELDLTRAICNEDRINDNGPQRIEG